MLQLYDLTIEEVLGIIQAAMKEEIEENHESYEHDGQGQE
jgi:hypothetical protein